MTTAKKYLRGWQNFADRYGTTPRTCQRMVKDERLPHPVYIGGSRFPMWEIEALDKHERENITVRPKQAAAAASKEAARRARGRPRKIAQAESLGNPA